MYKLYYLLLGMFLFCSCSHKTSKEKEIISVTIEPQKYFLTALVGDLFEVNCIVPQGQSPETFDPTPKDLADLQNSLCYFQIGSLGFEQNWTKAIRENNPNLAVIDLSEGFPLEESQCIDHHKGHQHEKGDGCFGGDPHYWTSIKGARQIARKMYEYLASQNPNLRDALDKNYKLLCDKINHVDSVLHVKLETGQPRSFIIFHPSLTYFAKEFNLRQMAIEVHGKEPIPSDLAMMIKEAKEQGVRTILIQEEFDQKNAEIIADELDAQIQVINPLSYDWEKEMLQIGDIIADGFSD